MESRSEELLEVLGFLFLINMGTQTCTKCKQEKPLTEFGKGNNQNDLQYKCRICIKDCNAKRYKKEKQK